MASSFTIDKPTVKKNIDALQMFIKEKSLDAFYVSSFDEFLNEYVPMENCHRFYFTGFTGSVASLLVPLVGRVKLYVDGRYHEQAEDEVDNSLVEVIKLKGSQGLFNTVIDDIKENQIKSIGVEGERTSTKFFKELSDTTKVETFNSGELSNIVDFAVMPKLNNIIHETKDNRGLDTIDKLKRVITSPEEAYFVTAIDSLAWITNCRGYHLPNLSSFLGRGFVTHDRVYVFIDVNTPVSKEAMEIEGVEFFKTQTSEIKEKLKSIINSYTLSKVNFDPSMLNSADYLMLKSVFDEKTLVQKPGGLVEFHAIKDLAEIDIMTRGFNKANKAIYNTIKWTKDMVAKGEKISERDIYNKTSLEYKKQGSFSQSFNTICGVGPNGSIMHYGNPKADIIIKETDMILLDSGGYFDGGFATDTTRTFMASSIEPDQEYKRIFTLVLKGVLQCQNSIFPEGTNGTTIDAFARKPIFDAGMNFAHGTGHGVVIHVHESGAIISPVTDIKMKVGQVVSIEPGIYVPGFGGVRIENIAIVQKHPSVEGFLKFKSLVYIGYEPKLIETSMLTDQEKVWLDEYEAECSIRGTSFQG